VRKDDAWLVRDLGSRNGTFLNETAVAEPTALKVGDEIRVGPLHFRVESVAKAEGSGSKTVKPVAAAEAVAPPPPSDVEIGSADVKRGKQPPVKDAADIAARASKQANGATSEEDISRWLLGLEGGGENSMRETQTLSLEETAAITRGRPSPEAAEAAEDETATAETTAEGEAEEAAKSEDASASKSGGWGMFKFGKKGAAKKSPGKLPPRPSELTKDSREAAADILREMTRRR
jgi:pSer/pThr/pTyr-binding forkhead associated (FHA) protein